MVGMEQENFVHRPSQNRIHAVILTRGGEHHMQEITAVGQIVTGIDKRLPNRMFVGHCRQGWHLGNQPMSGDTPMGLIGDIERVVIEGRECANQTTHDGHRVSITTESFEEFHHLLMHHGVFGDEVGKLFLFPRRWQIPVE